MRLDRKMVNIMDHENKEVVERFPINFVREPTAFTSNDPKVIISVQLFYWSLFSPLSLLTSNIVKIFPNLPRARNKKVTKPSMDSNPKMQTN